MRRREIEDYLYDPDVIEKFLVDNACDLSTIDSIHSAVEALEVEGKTGKRVSKQMFQTIKKSTGLKNLGQDEREFALVSLVPALMQTPHVVEELEQDIFG
ncbi:MAG: hypothetical protein F4039_05400 [Gammaproteobacteria bacterium]|nr:hypothetical protein [Gammaproteobacteria bacterium]MYF52983.1 hypothetical protein [Gammaproteobacteria bacterium]MYK43502.1 hypothetical protein [Gammaproteobacteria bacterium]